MGLLPDVARDLYVSIPAAGMLVSAHALGVTIGTPIVAIAVANMPRKKALMSLIGVFIVGNLLCAIAPNYAILMAARIVTAFCNGAFFGIGSVVAAGLVAPNRRAQAIALMFTGLTLANVLGQGVSWRATFWAVTGIGVLAAAALAACLPAKIEMQKASLVREFSVLKNPQVLMVLGISVLASASLFSTFTYITPILEDVTGFTPHAVILVLLFGLGLTVGSTIGGKLADWWLMPSLVAFLLAIVVILAVFAGTMHSEIPTMITIFV
ncbi:MAG: Arabinose efflux permease [uncultured Paraburkholderia sp.]|nr:MAG: Arabinose efflux permease [uncultured Paraburkholderia sp.]CAH2920649.1 MAG: Arabinose efflux permease [uncultured Paraburkholderia sp.]